MCISNISGNGVAAGLRLLYTHKGTALNLAAVKCLPFQLPFILTKTKSSLEIMK